jgi:hypothetical protein
VLFRSTSGNLYNYIGKKEDIVTLVIRTHYAHLFKFIHEGNEYSEVLSPIDALGKAVDQFFMIQHMDRDMAYFVNRDFNSIKPAMRLMITESSANATAVFEKIIKKGCVQGVFKVQNTWMAAHSIRALGQIWSVHHMLYSKRCTINQYIELQLGQIFDMLNCNSKTRDK